MKNPKFKSACLIILLFISVCCTNNKTNQECKETVVCNEIGWEMEIPCSFSANTDSLNQRAKTGRDKPNQSSFRQIIQFQKDPFNLFSSSIEPFIEKYAGEYDTNIKSVNRLIYETHVKQGIRIDTLIEKEMIDSLEFYALKATIYGIDNKPLLYQIIYSRLINNLDFVVTINYNDTIFMKEIIGVWKKSIFDKSKILKMNNSVSPKDSLN